MRDYSILDKPATSPLEILSIFQSSQDGSALIGLKDCQRAASPRSRSEPLRNHATPAGPRSSVTPLMCSARQNHLPAFLRKSVSVGEPLDRPWIPVRAEGEGAIQIVEPKDRLPPKLSLWTNNDPSDGYGHNQDCRNHRYQSDFAPSAAVHHVR